MQIGFFFWPFNVELTRKLAALAETHGYGMIGIADTPGNAMDPWVSATLVAQETRRPVRLQSYPIVSTVVLTFGGLKVDSRARVLNHDGDPISGLYAAGETMGLYFGAYTGATSVLKGAVFGRLAGIDAAERLQAGG